MVLVRLLSQPKVWSFALTHVELLLWPSLLQRLTPHPTGGRYGATTPRFMRCCNESHKRFMSRGRSPSRSEAPRRICAPRWSLASWSAGTGDSLAREDPDLAIEFMEAMVLRRDYGGDEEAGQLPEMLNGTLGELVQHHPGALEETVTRWFASYERRLHRAARDLVHDIYDITGRSTPWLKLSKPVLDGLEEQTVVYTLQRIMGHVMVSRALAALLLSAARREPCSQGLLAFIAGALAGYVLRNYPHEAGDYLRQRLEADDIMGAEAEVARTALDASDAYLARLNGLPTLNEFQPPSQHRYLLRLAEHRQQTEIMNRAKESSVLLNIMPELPLKYGRSHFTERDGNFTEPSELVPFSVSAEKPRAEILDPIGHMFRRLGWQSAGLNEGESTENQDPENERPDEEAGR